MVADLRRFGFDGKFRPMSRKPAFDFQQPANDFVETDGDGIRGFYAGSCGGHSKPQKEIEAPPARQGIGYRPQEEYRDL